MPRFAALAQAGCLYQVGQKLTATALLNGCFALFNNMNTGFPIWLISAKVQSSAAMEVDLLSLIADPALTAGNKGSNLYLNGRAPQATFEAQVIATPGGINTLAVVEASNNNTVELVDPGMIYLPRNTGILIQSAAIAGDCVVTLLWAEIDADFENSLYDAE